MNQTIVAPTALQDFLKENRRLAIAFSGGTDSAYLLYAAAQCGCDVQAYYVRSQFQPRFELEDARRLAEQLGVPMKVLEADVLQCPQIACNPTDRCYHCKNRLFTEILETASLDGYAVLCDGTNASDDASDRPGMRALRELNVRSPLRECGITKPQVREFSRQAGLFTWNKPAYACLATRIPAGTAITAQELEKIERAEQSLMELGFSDLRVRVFHQAARIQLPEAQFAEAVRRSKEIRNVLEPDFTGVLLDLKPR